MADDDALLLSISNDIKFATHAIMNEVCNIC